MISKSSKVIVALGALFAASSAMASGYGVKLQSGLTAGMANAGSGVSDDALAIYANPAAMIQNNTHQIAGNVTGVFGYTKFRGTASTSGVLSPIAGFVPNQESFSGTTGNASRNIAIPSFAVIANAADRLKVGVMVNTPFGLKFNYGSTAINRAHATRAEMRTMNVLPAFSLQIIDSLAFGAGLQMQYTKVKLGRKVALSSLSTNYSNVEGDDWSTGWTAGLFAQVTKAWKLGFSYKSKMVADLQGSGTFNPALAASANVNVSSYLASAKVKYPGIFTLSTSYDLNNCWSAFADIIYTQWNVVKDISIQNYTLSTTDVTPLDWKNSWFFSVGASYKISDSWSVRGGYAYDMSPTRNATRVTSIPDANKHWLAVGTTYNMGKDFGLTLSYGHEFFRNGKINLQQGLPSAANSVNYNKGTLVGRTKNHVDLVSLQFNYRF